MVYTFYMEITTINKIYYRPSEKAKNKIRKLLVKLENERGGRQTIQGLIEEIVIKSKI